jgi:hypothetical protein
MNLAEKLWEDNKRSDMSLVQMFDYFGQLTAQFPVRPLRVVYSKAGMQPAARILRNRTEIIENTLYWCGVSMENEALFLTAILNSETARKRVERFQARGQWGARHFDKAMFNLPIPRFDASQSLHNDIVAAAAEAERIAAAFELSETVKFQRARKLIRDALTESGIAPHIDALVARLLDQSTVSDDEADDE